MTILLPSSARNLMFPPGLDPSPSTDGSMTLKLGGPRVRVAKGPSPYGAIGFESRRPSAPPVKAPATRAVSARYRAPRGPVSRAGSVAPTRPSTRPRPQWTPSRGTLEYNNGQFVLTDQTRQRTLGPTLDFAYPWMPKVVAGASISVCYRAWNNGDATEFRLCGTVYSLYKSNNDGVFDYGFLSHPLYPDNLYFRVVDMDHSDQVKAGDHIAFRAIEHNGRTWTTRLYKLPNQ